MILSLAVLFLIWVPNLLVLQLAVSSFPESVQGQAYHQGWLTLGMIAITGLVFFGVGWLLSSMLESPTFAISGGLITPPFVITGIMTIGWLFKVPSATLDWLVIPLYAGICLPLALFCFAVGSAYYLRRVAP